MGRIIRSSRNHLRKQTPCPISSDRYASERRDWEQAKCSVCLEFPHNAVLLLCSSHDKGCRPYMCATSFRHSNCLDLFKKAYSRPRDTATSPEPLPSFCWPQCKKYEPTELSCPLCRGQVKGWTVVDPARCYLNKKKRTCIEDGCCFKGTYNVLKKHARSKHPRAKAREVDPTLQEKWKALETQSDHQDVLSTIRSTMPRSVVMGDYVIDMGSSDSDTDFSSYDEDDGFDDDDDGYRGSRQGRRGAGRSITEELLYLYLRERGLVEDIARFHRTSSVSEEGGSASAVAHQPEEGDAFNNSRRNRARTVYLGRDRRQERQLLRRSHWRSASRRS